MQVLHERFPNHTELTHVSTQIGEGLESKLRVRSEGLTIKKLLQIRFVGDFPIGLERRGHHITTNELQIIS